MTGFKSGFVSIIGRPNAGKSTLLNQLVNQKIAIVTDKPQTTRNPIIGIKTDDHYQIIFTDTPGIHKPHHELGSRMNRAAYAQMHGVDLIYYILDASVEFGKGDQFVIDKLKNVKVPVFCVLNKIDLITQEELLLKIMHIQKQFEFAEIIPISLKTNDNVETLLNLTLENLEDGIMYYPKDAVSAYPEQFIISEIIREKLINHTQEELPHSIAVAIEKMVQKKQVLVINVVIFVNRDSQKGMIIGKQGSMLKKIGQEARQELERFMNQKIFLELYVRVEKDWRNRNQLLNRLGYIEIEADE